MAAAGATASASTGLMNSLLGKLSKLLSDEYKLLKGVRKDIEFLRRELGSMNALLQRLADVEELDVQRKEWRNRVRELAYDIEDCIDVFMHRLGCGDADASFVWKALRKLKKLRARHQIASQIRELKSRVVEESDRCKRYYSEASTSNSRAVEVDPRLSALYVEANRLVGIASPREQLIELLMENREGGAAQKIKVLSIVGFGGLGKTTLATQVYDKIKGQFDCTAFVSVSQNPNIKNILMNILKGVGASCCMSDDEQELIKKLREYLQDKRYLIVIDDLWSTEVWNIIKCAFIENSCCNGVMTTTRIESVAAACCYDYNGEVYKIKLLDELDSRMLFFRRIFGSEDACPEQLKDNAKNILKKCGGVPLALISIASLLASQEVMCKEKWEYIQNSLGFELEANSSLGWMNHVLNLSYNDLSHDLRTCLLYLGMFPEDSIVRKDDLVRQWVAEGLVNDKYGQDPEVVAGSYFNDLVNRSMIQLTDFGKGRKCGMHDLMLDFIISKSVDENFLTIIDDKRNTKGSFKARRVSLQFNSAKYMLKPESMGLMQVRSLAFRGNANSMPYLSAFKLLRVLDLVGYANNQLDLTYICSLHQLRYLRIKSMRCKLPQQIRSLQHLNTLELGRRADSIPSDISHLSSLQHLIFSQDMFLPNGIGRMTALRTLKVFNLGKNSESNIQDIGKLTNLTELKIYHSISSACLNEGRQHKENLLVSSLGKPSNCNLRSLCFSRYSEKITCDVFGCWCPPSLLQRLHMRPCPFSKLPAWIAQLNQLTSLELCLVESPTEDALEVLVGLTCLIYLFLDVQAIPDGSIIFCSTVLPCLTSFGFSSSAPCLTFKQGALPKLQKLDIITGAYGASAAARDGRALVGIEHLKSLEKVSVCIDCWYAGEYAVESVEDALRSAIKMHPRCPNIQIKRIGATAEMFTEDFT